MSKVIENYMLKEVVGSGQYGKVFKSTHTKTGEVYAVKVIKFEKFKNVPKLHEFTNNEIQTLTKLSNPNVITFVEMLRTPNNVYLVYEFCNGGTLEDIIKKKKFLSEKEALIIFQQIINAFKSLFKEHILHRDLKPSNILLHDGLIKVADFGFCKTLLSPHDLTQTMVGSPIYMAPEILKGCNYNIKADIWSMGVVLFEMLFGFCPYEDKTIASLIGQIDHKILLIPKHINSISPQLEELLLRMLTVDPHKRIDWNTLLNYHLFDKSPLLHQNLSQFQTGLKQPVQVRQFSSGANQPSAALQQQQQQPQQQQMNVQTKKSEQGNEKSESDSKTSYLKQLVNMRGRIIYQVRTLNNVLEQNDGEWGPIVSFVLMKNVSNESEYLRNQLKILQFQEGVQQLSQIIQKELEYIQTCLDSFKDEIDKLLQYNIYFSSNQSLKAEQNTPKVDFQYFKTAFLNYIDLLKNKYSLPDNIQAAQNMFNQNNGANSLGNSILKYGQHINDLLNCLLSDEYFDNQLDLKYNDLDNPSKIADYPTLCPIIFYKIELAKNKLKPSDKYSLFQ